MRLVPVCAGALMPAVPFLMLGPNMRLGLDRQRVGDVERLEAGMPGHDLQRMLAGGEWRQHHVVATGDGSGRRGRVREILTRREKIDDAVVLWHRIKEECRLDA